MAISQMVGASIKRREDPELVTGTGSFVDDLPQTGLAYMSIVRSPEPHARIVSIETSRAREADGVVAIFTGKDLRADFQAPMPVTPTFVPDKKAPDQYPIATDKVRYVGEPVAIVLATSKAAAEDAAERVEVRYQPLPPVTDIEKAIETGASLIHEDLGTNLSYDTKFAAGDIEGAFREADIRFKQRLVQQRLIPIAIEGRGVVADYKKFANTLTIWSSTQIPHFVKVFLAVILGIPESQVRVVAPDVGGGFGSKIRVYPEELLTALASKKLGRPVKWIEDRNENMRATHHGRSQLWDVEVAAKKDGTLLGVRVTQWLDLGAYCSQFGTFMVIGLLVAQGAYLGIGLATYIEICGLGPAAATQAASGVSLWGMSVVRLHFTGKATVIIGSSPHGQGHETTMAQVAADVLGLPIQDIDVQHGDTAIGPMGMDTYGSRSMALDGTAVHLSAVKVREKAKKIAAHLLEAAEEDVVYEGGRAFVKGSPSKAITIQEIAVAAFQTNRIPKGMEGGLEATTFFDPTNFVWPFGAHICVVEVDKDTGAVRILRYVAVDDCGIRINPMVVDGQLHGGIAQGIGQALLEEGIYGEDGQLKSGTLLDYLVPTAADLPSFELEATITPSPVNPIGVKGIGEAGTIASSAAVVNAIVDALEPFGVKDIDMPASPEKVWHLMHKNGAKQR